MPYRLNLKRSVSKEVERLHPNVRERVMEALEVLPDEPYSENSKQLKGYAIYAVRVGDYRILYTVDDDERMILVLRIRHRREVYRDL